MSSQDSKRLKRISSALQKTKFHRTSSMMDRRSKPVSVKQARKQASATGIKNVKGVIVGGPQGPERKKFEQNVGATAVSTGAPYVLSQLNGLAQGTAVNQRIGDRVHLKGMDFQFNVSIPGTTGSAGSAFIDIFLLVDTEPDEATATAATIFETTTTNLTYVQLDSLQRFQILKRERIYLDSADKLSYTFTWHQSFEMATRFGSGSTAPMTNDVIVAALSPATAATNFTPSISYINRVSFTDE